jgi:PAS domain S-box-containing protein
MTQLSGTGSADSAFPCAEAFDHAVLGMALLGAGGVLLRVNGAFAELLGATVPDCPGRTLAELADPEGHGRLAQLLEDLGDGSGRRTMDIHLRRRDGMPVWTRLHLSALGDPGARPAQVLCQVQDLTEERASLERQRMSEEKFARVFDLAPLYMGLTRMEEGTILDVNKAFCQLTGYRREEVIGRRSAEVGLIEHEDRRELLETLRRQGRVENRELALHVKDGRVLPCRISLDEMMLGGERILISIMFDSTEQKRAEAALRASEEKFSKAFTCAPMLLAVSRKDDGHILEVNDGFCQATGFRKEELVGRHAVDLGLVTPDQRRWLIDAMGPEGRVRNLPFTLTARDGRTIDCLTSVETIEVAGEQLMITLHDDVTEGLRIQRALEEKESRYRTLFERMAEGFAHMRLIYEQGKLVDWTYLQVNPAYLALTGQEGLAGRRVSEMLPGFQESSRDVVDMWDRVARSGLPERFEFFVPTLDAWYSGLASSPAPDEIIATFENVTEQKRAELALRDSESRFRELFEHSPVAVWEESLEAVAARFAELRRAGVVDLAGHFLADPEELTRLAERVRVIQVNDAGVKLMACAGAEELRGGVARFFTEATLSVFREEMVALYGGASTFEAEASHLDARGKALDIHLRLKVMPGHEANLSRVLVSMADLTERKAAEAERRRLERELDHFQRLDSLGRLAGGVAHDMNNVLAAIMAIGSVLQARDPQEPGLARDADAILKAAGRGRDLVKGLLDFSRKELGNSAELDLNELARHEAELLERTTLKRIQVELELEPALLPVTGEASSIHNALMNLCVNALDAMPERGLIRLITRNHGKGFVELAVQDSGEGMAPEVAARALEPFFTTKPAGKGTGLGLSQVYGTVKAHGGTLDIHSLPGQGTRVSMMFPSSPGQGPAGALPEEDPPPAPRSLSILLVDDEAVLRSHLARMLEILGHRTETADGGPEALGKLEAGLAVDLAILDLNMPGMDGAETLGRLRLLRPDLPVLFITGYADTRIPTAMGRFGQVRVLKKPFNLRELAAALGER